MGKTVIRDNMFPGIVKKYNEEGKHAVYAMLRGKYGIRQPSSVLARIRKSEKYSYDPDSDQFRGQVQDKDEALFLGLDELCGKPGPGQMPFFPADGKRIDMDGLVRELIGDRLLTLSQYIRMDTSARIIYIDSASLAADGYQVVGH